MATQISKKRKVCNLFSPCVYRYHICEFIWKVINTFGRFSLLPMACSSPSWTRCWHVSWLRTDTLEWRLGLLLWGLKSSSEPLVLRMFSVAPLTFFVMNFYRSGYSFFDLNCYLCGNLCLTIFVTSCKVLNYNFLCVN